jgi:hypothetical protein
MDGIIIAFDTSIWPDDYSSREDVDKFYQAKIEELVKMLVAKQLEFSLCHIYLNTSPVMQLTIKFHWDEQTAFLRTIKYATVSESFNICGIDNCWQPVAAQQQAEGLSTILHERTGVDPHPIHEFCWHHINAVGREICRTVETLNETPPGERWWSKIVIWQLRKRWYAQRVEYDQETGDFGTILAEYIVATPWIGPKDDREAALVAAREYSG